MNRDSRDTPPICFECGNEVRLSNHWNRLPDGAMCPTCRDRMLDMVLPPLPRQGSDLPHELLDEEFFTDGPSFDEPRRA
jgi:DNA-directed RNA polymerase subunit RPC12/RpoP